MLDHVFSDAIGALRASLENALLERQAVEERYTTDSLVGDTRWETAYGLPGSGQPPRVQCEAALVWPTWSQTAYRRWYLIDELNDVPEIEVEVIFRAQGLSKPPNARNVVGLMPAKSPRIGREDLVLATGPTVEHRHGLDVSQTDYAIELVYAGSLGLTLEVLEDGNRLDDDLTVLGGWISSSLVALDDAV